MYEVLRIHPIASANVMANSTWNNATCKLHRLTPYLTGRVRPWQPAVFAVSECRYQTWHANIMGIVSLIGINIVQWSKTK